MTTPTMLQLGAEAPAFTLRDADGKPVSLDDVASGPAYVVMFICNHCPYVKHVEKELGALAAEYQAKGAAFVAVMPNDTASHPEDGPDGMRDQAERAGFTFPYLLDVDQEAATAYGAACTPDFFVLDADRRLAYRGRMDASRPRSDEPVTGADLRAALEALLAGEPVPSEQQPSMGCSIKWKPGNEPG